MTKSDPACSMFQSLKTCYNRAPWWLRRPVGWVPYSMIAGRGYRSTLRLCQAQDTLSRDEVLLYQEHALGQLLRHAVEQVPFYQRFRPLVDRLDPFDALAEFPLLAKEDVQRHGDALMANPSERILCHVSSTGGASGNQLVFLEDDATYAREMGFMHAQWGRVGYNPACKKATFRGVPLRQVGNGCFWQHNPIHNELQFSPFHMHEATLGSYVQRLVEHGPEFIHGYPSAVDTLAEYVLRHELTARIPSIRAALLGSEACSKAQRDRIGAAFHTRVYTWYGHSERTILGGECECSEVYHAFPAYGVLEIVREDGTPCAVGEQGEIVGTGFLNRAMPFIRYRTDDYATRDSCECECGRTWDRFSNVVGRRSVEGLLIGKNGTRISDAALNMHGECFKNVIRYQYYQEVPGQLVIRIIPNPWYSTADEARIVAAHENKLWGEMEILVQSVEEIPLTASGKQRRILCEAVQLQGRPC